MCAKDIILPLFLRLFDCILETFRMYSVFVFYFITLYIDAIKSAYNVLSTTCYVYVYRQKRLHIIDLTLDKFRLSLMICITFILKQWTS